MQCHGNTLTVTYSANPEAIASARHALTTFATEAGADPRQAESVRLAVSEAVTNAVLHAYRDVPGDVHVTAASVSGELWVLVSDDGGGMQARADRPGLGLGLALISQVSNEMSVVARAGGGTEVRMRFALVSADRSQPSSSAPIGGMAADLHSANAARPAEHRGCSVDRRARRPA